MVNLIVTLYAGTILFSMCFLKSFAITDGNECNLYYLTQPIQQLGCNSYENLGKFSLECNTYALQEVDYNILWYKNLGFTNDLIEVLNSSQTTVTIVNSGALSHKQSKLTLSNLTINDVGEYWCQIALMENGTVSELLEPSQKATLLHPPAYSKLLPCPNTFLHEFTTKCAERCNDSSNALPNTTNTTTSDDSIFEIQLCGQLWIAAAIVGGLGLILLLCITCWCVTVCTCTTQKTRIKRSTKEKNTPGTIDALTLTQALSSRSKFPDNQERTNDLATTSFMVHIDDEQVPNDKDSHNQDIQHQAPSRYEFPESPEQMHHAASPFVNSTNKLQLESKTNEKRVSYSNEHESPLYQPEVYESPCDLSKEHVTCELLSKEYDSHRNSTSNSTSVGNTYQELDVAAIMINSYAAVTAVTAGTNEQNEFEDAQDKISDDGIYWNDDTLPLPNDESSYATVQNDLVNLKYPMIKKN